MSGRPVTPPGPPDRPDPTGGPGADDGVDIALVICPPMRGSGPTPTASAIDGRWHSLAGWSEIVAVDDVATVLPFPAASGDGDQRRVRVVSDWRRTAARYLVFVPADCRVTDEAHGAVHELLRHNPAVELAYFDSAEFDPADPSELVEAHHRPGFSPERLRAQMYLGPAFLVSRRLADELDPSAPLTHLAALELAAAARAVAHIPRLVYHVPGGDPDGPVLIGQAVDARQGLRARHQALLDAAGFPAIAQVRGLQPAVAEPVVDLRPSLAETPPVSIVIPTNGAQRDIDGRPVVLCLQAIDSVIAETTYPDYELVLVITPGAPDDLAAQIVSTIDRHPPSRQPTVRFCRDDRAFNFSNACNRGAVAATGAVLVFLNDDTLVETADWLDRLVMYATRPDIGAVGARLLDGDRRIQHSGIWTRGGHPAHRYDRFPADHDGYLGSLSVPQNCLAVTGACLGVSAEKFRRVGGFSPEFPSSYNDVDLCLKLDDYGYRTVVDPGVVLTHYEASSRDPSISDRELALLHERWRSVLNADPYDNPNHLAAQSEEFPPPDPMVTAAKERAGWIDHLPRVWPRPRLTVDPELRRPDDLVDTTPVGPV